MAVRAVCPECGATTTLEDNSPKKSVECRQCGSAVPILGAKATAPPPVPPQATPDTGFDVLDDEEEDERPRPASRRRDDDEEEDDDQPRRRTRLADDDELDDQGRPAVGGRDDDDDDRPRSRRRSRDEDDEEDERPARGRASRDEDDEEEQDERPARGRARRDEEDEDEEDERPARSRARRDEEDEEDERPARSRASRDEDDEKDEAREDATEAIRAAFGKVGAEDHDEHDEEEDEVDDIELAWDEDEEEEDDDEPVSKRARSSGDDEEDDEDVSIPRIRPGDGRSQGRRPSGGSKKGMLIAGMLMLLALAVGGAALGYVFFLDDEEPKVVKKDDEENPPEKDPDPVDPKVDPKIDPKPPEIRDLAILPVKFEGERKTIPLPGKVTDIFAGGDGRFLFCHCPEQKKLLVYDATEAAIVKEIPTNGKDSRVAAGATKLLLADNATRTFQRFDLLRLEKDKEGAYPFEGTIEDVCMGSGSDGPALVLASGPADTWPAHFVDVETLGKADVGWSIFPPSDLPKGLRFSAAANGTRFVALPPGDKAKGVVIVSRDGKALKAELFAPDKEFGYAALSANGTTLFSRFGAQAVGAAIDKNSLPDGVGFTVPSVSGSLFVTVLRTKSRAGEFGIKVAVSTRPGSPASSSPRTEIPQPYNPGDSMPPDRHVYLIPESESIVIFPSGPEQKLEVVKLNLVKEGSVGPLQVTSTAPTMFHPGQPFRYKLRSIGAAEKREYGVTGPDGVKVSADGVVTWDVPTGETRDVHVIQVTVTSAGIRTKHDISVTNASLSAPKAVAVKPKDPKDPIPKPKDPKVDPKVPVVVGGPKLVTDAGGKLPITPPTMKDAHIEVELPGPIGDACVAGGGRYLIFLCPTARKLAIFDVNTLKVEKTITVNSDDVLFAASMEKLIVVYPSEKVVIRYSLATFKLETDIALESIQKPNVAAMGSATSGPLILGGIPAQNNASKMTLTYLDLDTMKEVLIEKAEGEFRVGFGGASHLRVSADGRTLGARRAQLQPSGLQVARLSGNSIEGSYLAESVGHVTPGPDGQTIFTEKGMYNTKGEPIGRRETAVPALHGNQFLTVAPAGKGPADSKIVSIWEPGKDTPLASFDDLPGFNGKMDPFERANPNLGIDRKLMLVPEAKILVVIPPAANKLHVYKVDGKK